jgi:hypothetical protein
VIVAIAWHSLRSRGPLLIALAAIGACVLVDAALVRIGLDELDEGYFAEQAARVLHGELPYRDFESLYTPGVLYLSSWIFAAAGGPTLIGLRLASLAIRALVALGMYHLGRALVPGCWAMWPPLLLLVGLDTIPAGWEPHPGWYAALGAIVVVWAGARVPDAAPGRRWVWLGITGAAAALTFVCKQNAGVLIGLAVVELIVLQGCDVPTGPVTPALRRVQWGTAIGMVGLVLGLVRPYLDPAVALLVVSPVLLTSLLLLSHGKVDKDGVGLRDRLGPLIPFAAGWSMVTLPWLAVLLVSLGGDARQLGAFVGAVDQSGLYFPPQLPGPVALAVVGIGVLIVAGARAQGGQHAVLLLVGAVVVGVTVGSTRLADEPTLASVLLAPERVGFGIVSLLPAIAAWSTAWLARAAPVSAAAWRLRWYLVAGSLFLITQYPRMDTFHLAWSAPLLLVLGGVVLACAHTWLTQRWPTGRLRTGLVALGLLSVGLSAAMPAVYQRAGVLFVSNPDTGWPERTWLVQLDRPAIVDGFRIGVAAAWQLRDLLDYLDAETSPGEAIFVYPSSPLLYVLANRPNPTRYSHVYPSMSTADQQLLANTLDRAGVRVIVVSDAWLDFWGTTDGDVVMTAYLSTNFQERAQFGVFRVLVRAGST